MKRRILVLFQVSDLISAKDVDVKVTDELSGLTGASGRLLCSA